MEDIKEVARHTESFYERVEMIPIAGCWIWKGTSQTRGYGAFYTSRTKKYKAHRFSYMLHKGPIPDGMHVCHVCDTPSCVNPNHLFLGTHKDNMQDMTRKGRNRAKAVPGVAPSCERHGNAKLTNDQAAAIKAEYRYYGYRSNATDLAAKYGVERSTITKIVFGHTWTAL